MTDAEWAEVRTLLPIPGWLEGRSGQPEGYCHLQRAALRSLFACPWRRLCTTRYTTDDPPCGTVTPGVSCAPKRTASQPPSGRQELGSPCRIPGGRRGLERRTPATHHPAPQLQNIAAEKLLKVFEIGSARDYVTAESAGTAPEQAVIPVTQGAACGLRRAPWPQRQQLSGAQDNSRMSHTRRRPAPNAGAFQRYGPSCSWCSSTLSAGRGRGEGRNTGGHHDSVTRRCRRSASSSAPTTVRTGVPGGANMVTTSCDCVSRRLLAPW